ncbi:hypothetical protein ACFL0U_03325, partial [Pseudomonadota bacterium]
MEVIQRADLVLHRGFCDALLGKPESAAHDGITFATPGIALVPSGGLGRTTIEDCTPFAARFFQLQHRGRSFKQTLLEAFEAFAVGASGRIPAFRGGIDADLRRFRPPARGSLSLEQNLVGLLLTSAEKGAATRDSFRRSRRADIDRKWLRLNWYLVVKKLVTELELDDEHANDSIKFEMDAQLFLATLMDFWKSLAAGGDGIYAAIDTERKRKYRKLCNLGDREAVPPGVKFCAILKLETECHRRMLEDKQAACAGILQRKQRAGEPLVIYEEDFKKRLRTRAAEPFVTYNGYVIHTLTEQQRAIVQQIDQKFREGSTKGQAVALGVGDGKSFLCQLLKEVYGKELLPDGNALRVNGVAVGRRLTHQERIELGITRRFERKYIRDFTLASFHDLTEEEIQAKLQEVVGEDPTHGRHTLLVLDEFPQQSQTNRIIIRALIEKFDCQDLVVSATPSWINTYAEFRRLALEVGEAREVGREHTLSLAASEKSREAAAILSSRDTFIDNIVSSPRIDIRGFTASQNYNIVATLVSDVAVCDQKRESVAAIETETVRKSKVAHLKSVAARSRLVAAQSRSVAAGGASFSREVRGASIVASVTHSNSVAARAALSSESSRTTAVNSMSVAARVRVVSASGSVAMSQARSYSGSVAGIIRDRSVAASRQLKVQGEKVQLILRDISARNIATIFNLDEPANLQRLWDAGFRKIIYSTFINGVEQEHFISLTRIGMGPIQHEAVDGRILLPRAGRTLMVYSGADCTGGDHLEESELVGTQLMYGANVTTVPEGQQGGARNRRGDHMGILDHPADLVPCVRLFRFAEIPPVIAQMVSSPQRKREVARIMSERTTLHEQLDALNAARHEVTTSMWKALKRAHLSGSIPALETSMDVGAIAIVARSIAAHTNSREASTALLASVSPSLQQASRDTHSISASIATIIASDQIAATYRTAAVYRSRTTVLSSSLSAIDSRMRVVEVPRRAAWQSRRGAWRSHSVQRSRAAYGSRQFSANRRNRQLSLQTSRSAASTSILLEAARARYTSVSLTVAGPLQPLTAASRAVRSRSAALSVVSKAAETEFLFAKSRDLFKELFVTIRAQVDASGAYTYVLNHILRMSPHIHRRLANLGTQEGRDFRVAVLRYFNVYANFRLKRAEIRLARSKINKLLAEQQWFEYEEKEVLSDLRCQKILGPSTIIDEDPDGSPSLSASLQGVGRKVISARWALTDRCSVVVELLEHEGSRARRHRNSQRASECVKLQHKYRMIAARYQRSITTMSIELASLAVTPANSLLAAEASEVIEAASTRVQKRASRLAVAAAAESRSAGAVSTQVSSLSQAASRGVASNSVAARSQQVSASARAIATRRRSVAARSRAVSTAVSRRAVVPASVAAASRSLGAAS